MLSFQSGTDSHEMSVDYGEGGYTLRRAGDDAAVALAAPDDGTVTELRYAVGDQVAEGAQLVGFEQAG